ncbi:MULTISPECIES: hypothetical protein [unclassified Bacillus cereus group]|uniref:hypothetical protein n=1 Tax=unclassified Bacillus cereus group TaxID=2750818 RepID=UPI0024C863B0|nr:MAG: hypothetical protein NRZ50_18040 [Bacillus paranthracis]WAI32126.1 MAG: hypothetical protein NRZ52_25245 [Bacillus paranthracis]WAI39726.1 MAG: hypothetical protein NRZ51_07275 [Bacillus paranthracis]
MSKKEVRIQILDLQEQHCIGCAYRYSRNVAHCWTNCETGIRINELGVLLGGRLGTEQKKPRTAKEWNRICKNAVKLSNKGLTYVEIAKKYSITTGNLHKQMKKRRLK